MDLVTIMKSLQIKILGVVGRLVSPVSQAVSEHSLEAEEIHQIGVSTVNAGYYDTGIEWLELARQRMKSPQQKTALSQQMKTIDVTNCGCFPKSSAHLDCL